VARSSRLDARVHFLVETKSSVAKRGDAGALVSLKKSAYFLGSGAPGEIRTPAFWFVAIKFNVDPASLTSPKTLCVVK
jgi:hypothetical protein